MESPDFGNVSAVGIQDNGCLALIYSKLSCSLALHELEEGRNAPNSG